nr:ubiquinone biosynthesis monooxygenase UbiB [uncultured bacterium]
MTKNTPPSLRKRYQKVIYTLFKYGFEDIVAHPPLNRLVPKSKRLIPQRDGKSVLSFTRYERMRMVCEELGTTFIKFAQIASNRPDLLPEELIEEMVKFQDDALPVPVPTIKEILKEEYERPLEELFEEIDYTPLASASMAQVHRARLIGGKEVVLKIQRPEIVDTIETDIIILKQLVRVIENYFPHYASFQPMELVKMFEKSIHKELNFKLEMANLQQFQSNFAGHEDIYTPRGFPEFSTQRILCMEYIDGVKITDLEALAKIGLSGPDLALKGINLYFIQVFDHGFFHADPHPGNIFVLKNKDICFIDYGMMGQVVDSDKELLADLLLAVYDRDVDDLKRALLHFSWKEQQIDEKMLEYDIIEFFSNYSDITLESIDGNEIIAALNSLFFEYKIKVPSNMLLLLKALVIIEGVGLHLDPHYNIIKNIEPYVRRLVQQKYSPEKLSRNFIRTMGDTSQLLRELPDDLKAVVHKMKQGKLHIEFEHKGLEPLYKKMEIVSNRISFTLLLAALIIGSSLMVIADTPPHIYRISVLGFAGFIISGLLALRLLYSIIRNGFF